MKNKKINFFIKKNSLLFFFVPLIIITLFASGTLIATSWYFIDYQIAKTFAEGLKYEFIKYWTRFYDQLGNSEFISIFIIYLTILLETWFLTKIKEKNNKFKKNYWILKIYYPIVFIIWIIGNITNIILISTSDTGFGAGIDYVLIDSIKYRLTGAIIGFIFQTMILFFGLWYVKFLIKNNRLLKEQYWIKSLKTLSFLVITYIIIITLKGTTGHLFYYNTIFGDLLKKCPNELIEHYKKSEFNYGYNLTENIPWELQHPWWKPNLMLLNSNKEMPRFNYPWDYAFPSGHINATYCTGAGILLFLENKDNKHINWKVKTLFILWLMHVLSMNFALIVERWHWASDTAFTFIFSSAMILFVNFIINKIFYKKLTN